jgi:hypothetical protein
MARRSAILPYVPSNPPTGTNRAVWDEFYKLQQALADLDRPLALSITSTKSIPVQATTVWTRLFNEGIGLEYALPADQFDTTTGIWTVPQEGLYSVTIIVEIPAFPNAGNRLYEATLRTTVHPVDGSADRVVLSKAGGPDEATLRFTATIMRPLSAGDQIWFDIDLTEETFTGSVSVFNVLNIVRQGGYK